MTQKLILLSLTRLPHLKRATLFFRNMALQLKDIFAAHLKWSGQGIGIWQTQCDSSQAATSHNGQVENTVTAS